MSTTTKEDCVKVLNAWVSSYNSIHIAKTIISMYLEENNNPNKEKAIDMILQLPVAHNCIHHAIKQLCKKFDIIVVTRDNNYIYFY